MNWIHLAGVRDSLTTATFSHSSIRLLSLAYVILLLLDEDEQFPVHKAKDDSLIKEQTVDN